MALDKISEIVSHFIGIFETAEDGARMRDLSDGFRHTSDPNADFDAHASLTYLLRAPYTHAGNEDGLSTFNFSADPQANMPNIAAANPQGVYHHHGPRFDDIDIPDVPVVLPGPEQMILVGALPPGSTVIVGHQFNVMIDDDVMTTTGTTQFVSPDIHNATLSTLVEMADGMAQDMVGNPFDIMDDATTFGATLTVEYATLADTSPDGASVTVLVGGDAFDLTINGTAADTAPMLNDVLPAHHQTETSETEETPDAPTGIGGTAADAAQIFDVEDGHAIVAGGNFLINETIVAFSAVDAPIIAVMGDAISVTAISQVNVIQNHDSGGPAPTAPDVSFNIANIVATSSQTETDPADQPDTFPQGWAVKRVDADVMTVNWVHQYNFVTDHDRAEITFSGEDTYIDFGDNIALNQTTLLEIGQGYDLIIIGGQMIDMALINQTNVLLDDDAVTYSGDWPAMISTDDNLAFNQATIETVGVDSYTGMGGAFAQAGRDLAAGGETISADLAQSDYFAGTPFLNVLYISGDLITVTSIEQTNILGDADQVALQLAAIEDRPDLPDGPVTITSGSNAVVNIASILEYGMDSIVMVGGEVYDDVLLHQASLIDPDADALGVAHTPLANEAVAFLADDMVDDAPVDDAIFATSLDASTTSVDVMGSVVS